jgi:hypothetical protein
MPIGLGLMRLVRLRRKKKQQNVPKPPNRRIVEGPLELVQEGTKETIKCWVVLTSEWLTYSANRVDTPIDEIRTHDMMMVHRNPLEDDAQVTSSQTIPCKPV